MLARTAVQVVVRSLGLKTFCVPSCPAAIIRWTARSNAPLPAPPDPPQRETPAGQLYNCSSSTVGTAARVFGEV
jgi:hypothetical protein